MHHIACGYDAEVMAFGQNVMPAKRKGCGVVIEERYIGPQRPQITRPRVCSHSHGERVGCIGISRLQQVEERFALMGTDGGQGPEESHVRQRHLAWSISRQAHTYMRPYELQVETTNKTHLQLIVGAHQKFTKGRDKRQLATGREAPRARQHILLSNATLEKALPQRLIVPKGF